MKFLRCSSLKEVVTLFCVSVGAGAVGLGLAESTLHTIGASSKAVPQSDEKVIERMQFPNEPLRLDNFTIKKTRIVPRHKFSARAMAESGGGKAEDWLESLQFTLRNDSNKVITFVLLQFRETEANGPRMVYNLHIGTHTKASPSESKSSMSLALQPKDLMTFTLSPDELQRG